MVEQSELFLPGTGRGTVRRTVEGNARGTGLHDVLDGGIQILKHFDSRDSQYYDITRRQPFVADHIPLGPVAEIMGFSIDFDRQPRFGAKEVENIRPSRMLSPKLESSGSRPQFAPQQAFGQTQLTAQTARTFDGLPRSGQHRAFPSTMLRMVPLPVPGRNWVRNGDLL